LFFYLNPNIIAVVVSIIRGELFWCLKKMTIGKIGMKRMKMKKRISRSLESKLNSGICNHLSPDVGKSPPFCLGEQFKTKTHSIYIAVYISSVLNTQ
jgi:hypothetical protein